MNMDRYSLEAVTIADSRGWDFDAHAEALASGDEDSIATTHPINWLTEGESEVYFA